MNKNVLFVATVVKTHINVFHLPFLKNFQDDGYQTSVAAKNDFKEEECTIPYCDKFYDVDFKRNPLHFKNVKAYRNLKKIINNDNFEIIHCHTPVGGLLTRFAARKARKKGTKIIYTAHGFHFYKGAPIINWLIYFPAEWICAFYTDSIITINQEDYNFAKKYLKAKNIEYVPGVGIDLKDSSNTFVNLKEKRDSIGVPVDATMLLSVGELIKRKNHKSIIQALSRIDNRNVYYVICGSGTLIDELKTLSKSLNVDKRVVFLGFRKDIKEICRIADLFIFPSLQEGLPVALMEAMSMGLPCIVSDIRGNSDLIQDGQGGYVCDKSNVFQYQKLIEQIINEKELMKKMGTYNMTAIQKFDIKNVMEKMNHIYKEK